MEKLKINSVILFSGLFLGTLTSSCQNNPQNQSEQEKDSSQVILIMTDSESFKLQHQGKTLIEGAIWDNIRISVTIIPLNDSLAEKLTYSNSRTLISKRQVKLINGKYTEDGLSYHFNDKGMLSHVYTFKNGVLNGESVTYYSNGMVESKGEYKDGNKLGVWEYFNNKGKPLKDEKF